MNFPKFKLLQDFEVETEFAGVKTNQKVFEKNKEFSANEKGIYRIEWFGGNLEFTIDQMREAKTNDLPLFEEIKSDYEIIIEEVDEDDENLIGNWRIQLDVKTTRKKLKEFEKAFKETIDNIL